MDAFGRQRICAPIPGALLNIGAIGLPAIDKPRFDLELVAREELDTHPVEEPGRVGGDVRRLVRPVVEVVVAEEPDIGHEDAGLDIDAVHLVHVIAAVGLRDVAIGVGHVPLSAGGGGVIAGCHGRVHAELRHEPADGVIAVKITAHAELLNLELAGAAALGRADQGVIRRMVEIADERDVGAEFASEILRVQHGRVLATVAVEPGEVTEREWHRLRLVVVVSAGACAPTMAGVMQANTARTNDAVFTESSWRLVPHCRARR